MTYVLFLNCLITCFAIIRFGVSFQPAYSVFFVLSLLVYGIQVKNQSSQLKITGQDNIQPVKRIDSALVMMLMRG